MRPRILHSHVSMESEKLMPKVDRREMLQAGIAFALPLGSASLLTGFQIPESNENTDDKSLKGANKPFNERHQNKEDDLMKIRYLEIVTSEVDALCEQYAATQGVTFGEPEANLGNARTAEFEGGGTIGIRNPLREDEAPVIRPYFLVEDLEKAVKAAADAGAEIALPSMEIPEHGTIAIVIQGGIETGLWKD